MSHPFGDLLTRYASRKHGLSQNRIADTAELEASVLSRMCCGERLSGPRARERVLRVILALLRHGALWRQREADQLLEAAEMAALHPGELEALIAELHLDSEQTRILHRSLTELHHRDSPEEDPGLLPGSGNPPTAIAPGPSLFPEQRLPAPEYSTLFGVAAAIQALSQRLSAPGGPTFLSLEGMGGIGKTALARAVVLACLQAGYFQTALWTSARHTRLTESGTLLSEVPAQTLADVIQQLTLQVGLPLHPELTLEEQLGLLYPLLRDTRYLIVLDNLETFAEIEALLPRLQPLAGATRFLLTSRHTLSAFPYIHVFKVKALGMEDSRALVESELARRDYGSHLPADFLQTLLGAVGGLPLALKLAAGQIGRLPLESILAELREAQGQTPEHLYAFIYRRSWELLDDSARQLLLALLTVDVAGETLEFIRQRSGLTDASFTAALTQLLDCSLVEVRPLPDQPRYALHPLTATFLHSGILTRWEN